MTTMALDQDNSILTDPIEKLIYELIQSERNTINIQDLYSKAIVKNFLAGPEFKYALSHLLSNQLVTLDFDGNISIK